MTIVDVREKHRNIETERACLYLAGCRVRTGEGNDGKAENLEEGERWWETMMMAINTEIEALTET